MTVEEFLAVLKECPLIASVQASPGSPLDDPETLLKLAKASLSQGVKVLRLEGVENIKRIKGETDAPVIGLIKRRYPDSELYITPTMREVEELIETGCEVIAMDARRDSSWGSDETDRSKAELESFAQRVDKCHSLGRLVLADCFDSDDLDRATDSGVDLGSTTFSPSGYGGETFQGPSLHDLGQLLRRHHVPILAEGLYATESQIRWAMHMGVAGVVVGGALNDPVKTSQRFVKAATTPTFNVGAVDIGGTWIRFGLFSPEWKLLERRRVKLPTRHSERLKWIERQARSLQVGLVGVSTGGKVDPYHGTIVSTKETIPDNEFAKFSIPGIRLRVLNDGLATAWGHVVWGSRNDRFQRPGERTVTLAIGTGLGCGITSGFGLLDSWSYPRLNDLEYEKGMTFEEALGGLTLGQQPLFERQELALRALEHAIEILARLIQPSALYICGGVGLSPWMKRGVKAMLKRRVFAAEWGGRPRDRWATNPCDVQFSPFGPDAGLYGAAALALWPPIGVFPE